MFSVLGPLLLAASSLGAAGGECRTAPPRDWADDSVALLQTSWRNSKRHLHAAAAVAPERSKDEAAAKHAAQTRSHEWKLHKLDLWKYPHAQCLDGSPGSFYLRNASNLLHRIKWAINLEGGSWCALDVPDREKGWKQMEHCLERTSRSLGSSIPLQETPDHESTAKGVLSVDKELNPLMHDWNHVYVNYCDGGSFSGRNISATIVNDCTDASDPKTCSSKELHFKGNFVLEAIIDTLKEHALQQATEVVLSGCGSGGLATILHADKLKAALPSAFVSTLVDSGFFLDWSMSTPTGETRDFGDQLRSVFDLHNATGAMNEKCVEKQGQLGDPASSCFFPEHATSYMSVPTFAAQSTVDSFQLNAILGANFTSDNKAQLGETVNTYRRYMELAMNMSLLSQHQNGAFVSSCQYHCGHWDDIVIDGLHISSAFKKWHEGRLAVFEAAQPSSAGSAVRLWQSSEWPCTDCCDPEKIHIHEEEFAKDDNTEGRPSKLERTEADAKKNDSKDTSKANNAESDPEVAIKEGKPNSLEGDLDVVDGVAHQEVTADQLEPIRIAGE